MRKLIVFIFLLTITPLFSLEIMPELGISTFNYAEVGSNNKDDLYTIKSVLGGLSIGVSNRILEFSVVSSFQIPLSLKLSDALGSDDRNYLFNLIFFGGNFRWELKNKYDIGGGYYLYPILVGNYDVFYFKDNNTDDTYTETYYYSILGVGGGAQLSFISETNIKFSIKFLYIKNILPISPVRDGEFIGSNNIGFTFGVGKNF